MIKYLYNNKLARIGDLLPGQLAEAIAYYDQFRNTTDVNFFASINTSDDGILMAMADPDRSDEILENILKSIIDRYLLVIIALAMTDNKLSIDYLSSQLVTDQMIRILSSQTFDEGDKIFIDQEGIIEILGDKIQYAVDTIRTYYATLYSSVKPTFPSMERAGQQTITSATVSEPNRVNMNIKFNNTAGYLEHKNNIVRRIDYLSVIITKKMNQLTILLYNLIVADPTLAEFLTKSAEITPACFKSSAELSEQITDTDSPMCAISLDLFIDYLTTTNKPVETPFGPTPVLTRTTEFSDLDQNESLQTIKNNKDVTRAKQSIHDIQNELAELHHELKKIAIRTSRAYLSEIDKVVSHNNDYTFNITQPANKTIKPISTIKQIDVNPIIAATSEEDMGKIIGELSSKIKKHDKKQSIDFAKLGHMDTRKKEHKEEIDLLRDKRNNKWDSYIVYMISLKESTYSEHVSNDTLRSHINLLHYAATSLHHKGYFTNIIPLDEEYKTIFSNYQFAITNDQLDQLIGTSHAVDSSLVDVPSFIQQCDDLLQLDTPAPTQTTKKSVSDTNMYLKYILLTELNNNWPKTPVTSQKYYNFVKNMLTVFNNQREITDASSREIEQLLTIAAEKRRSSHKVPSDRFEKKLLDSRRRLGIKTEETDEPISNIVPVDENAGFVQTLGDGAEETGDGIPEGVPDDM
jgi:hypothetical protein